MHLAINKIVESRLTDDVSPKIAIPKKLYFYAEEAYELGHIDDARRHHQAVIQSTVLKKYHIICICHYAWSFSQAIATDRSDAEAWIKYAIFLLKIGDAERAKECCREAILSNSRDKFAYVKVHKCTFLVGVKKAQ